MTLTLAQVEEAVGPLSTWAQNCHAASLALVRSGLLDEYGQRPRVARGALPGVFGQHSWVVVGDPYQPKLIVDITAWSYSDSYPPVLVSYPTPSLPLHRPHGAGSIWDWGVPAVGDGPDVPLAVEVSSRARMFLGMVASQYQREGLDHRGWATLANAPVEGWPAAEIIAAMDDTPGLSALVPIDILGMLTDRNPGGLYW